MEIKAGMRVRIKTYEELAEIYGEEDGCIVVELPYGDRCYFNQEMRNFSGDIYTVSGVDTEDNEIWFENDGNDELDDYYWFTYFVEPVDDSCDEATVFDEDALSLLVQEFLLA